MQKIKNNPFANLFYAILILAILINGCRHKQSNTGLIINNRPAYVDSVSGYGDSPITFIDGNRLNNPDGCVTTYIAATGQALDSACNDMHDTSGADHYYIFGLQPVPQSGEILMHYYQQQGQGGLIYEAAYFINGYMAYSKITMCYPDTTVLTENYNDEVLARYKKSLQVK